MSSLTSLGMTPGQAIELISHQSILAAQKEEGGIEGVFDASDREEGGDIIIWWNDLEKDQNYASWSDNIAVVRIQESIFLCELMRTPIATSSYAPPGVPSYQEEHVQRHHCS